MLTGVLLLTSSPRSVCLTLTLPAVSLFQGQLMFTSTHKHHSSFFYFLFKIPSSFSRATTFEICSPVSSKASPFFFLLHLSLRSINEEQQVSNKTAQCIDSLHVALTRVSSKAALWFQEDYLSSVLIEFNTEEVLSHTVLACVVFVFGNEVSMRAIFELKCK